MGSADTGTNGHRIVPFHRRYDDDQVFLKDLRQCHRAAHAELYLRYSDAVERVIQRTMGFDQDIPDLVQETFLCAIRGIEGFRGDIPNLKFWLLRIAVNNVRQKLRRRRIHSWLTFIGDDRMPEPESPQANPEILHRLRHAYAILDSLNAEDRIVFTLRILDRMKMEDVAELCDMSLSTAKRRFSDARDRFMRRAKNDPMLADLAQGVEP